MRFPTGLVLFDAAGTLIEPAEPVEKVYREHFARQGWAADEGAIGRSFRAAFGRAGEPDFSMEDGEAAERAWWARIVGEIAAEVGIDPAREGFRECFDGLFAHYAEGAAWRVFSEAWEVLEALRAKGAAMAIVSNFDRRLHRVLGELGLADRFDLVLTSAEVRRRKPSPELLREAMARFGLPPKCVRLVGDSEAADGGAARAAGVGFFRLDRPRTTLADFARWLEEDFFQK